METYSIEKKTKILLAILLSLGLIALVALFVVAIFNDKILITKDTIQYELYKAMAQFVSLGLLGAVVAVLLRDYENDRKSAQDTFAKINQKARDDIEKEKENRKYRKEELKSYYRNLRDVYGRSKMVRRMLRAKSSPCLFSGPVPKENDPAEYEDRETPARCIAKSEYFELMIELENIQLKLETLKKNCEIDFSDAQDLGNEISGILRAAEKYLSKINDDFEFKRYAQKENEVFILLGSATYSFIANRYERMKYKNSESNDDSYFNPIESVWRKLIDYIKFMD